MIRLFLLCLSLVLATPLRAQIAGAEDPRLMSALQQWLAAEELPALQAMAALAGEGNVAAQVFLGVVDATPAFQGPDLARLPRAERLALMRAPGGLSGTSWMRAAAATDPLAQTWLRLWSGDATAQVVLDFAALGETRAARMAARQLFLREKRGFGVLAGDPAFPPSLLPLAIRDWQTTDPARAAAALQALHPGDPARGFLGLGAPAPDDLLDWAGDDPLGRHLLPPLAALCPAPAPRGADLAAWMAQAGGWWALAWAGPPVETLIPPDRLAASPMGQRLAINLMRKGDLADAARLAASPCIQGLLAQADPGP